MYDEPSVADFPALAAWAASVAARAPGLLRFINLLPNYAVPGALNASSYGEYLSAFIRAVAPDMLCFDHYPAFGPGSATDRTDNATMRGYIQNLADVRAAAQSAGLPFMNFFGAMPFNNRSDVTESQLRWQAFTSLAHGAAGVLYFCYWTPTGDSFLWGGGVYAPFAPVGGGAPVYAPGPHYAHAQRINAKLRTLGDFLVRARSVAVFEANGTRASSAPAPAAAAPLARVGGSDSGPAWSLLCGVFALPASAAPATLGILVTNQDADLPVLATLRLSPGARRPLELDPKSGAITVALDDAPALGGGADTFRWALEAGDARLLLF
jgi:hypothetical protein